ncbi:alpha/beta hydrolase [Amorphoplanes nipponensis]|uniref:Hydrolase or acyltransferase of alpha/beta superfamily protein n=1 Tax=Actinoplanes nipponensis TaxID=135950 RepID=A0A919JKZ1_9ACTN|nr:alpha/beta hydrolase [Actinoplanes nipponensis]GIE48714.1 hydrolase or acyltransferase of alpha/beta superfamily protein [Actinoplanes nipponensis]
MRDRAGQTVAVNGRSVYVEQCGGGPDRVVFEAGAGCGRTCWDPLVPLLTEQAELVTYDRAGRALSGRVSEPLSIDDLAADLVALTTAVAPGPFVLVAHSMGGLIARRAAERLGSRLRGLLLVDPLPETSPVYDTWDRTTEKIDRMMAVTQPLSRFGPLARLLSGNVRRLYPADTYQTMLAEDFTPTGVAQTRSEMRAVAAAVTEFRTRPPRLPACPTIVLSAGQAVRGRERQHADNQEHQRRYADSLPDGRYEVVDSGHFIQAERPQVLAGHLRNLLRAASDRE